MRTDVAFGQGPSTTLRVNKPRPYGILLRRCFAQHDNAGCKGKGPAESRRYKMVAMKFCGGFAWSRRKGIIRRGTWLSRAELG